MILHVDIREVLAFAWDHPVYTGGLMLMFTPPMFRVIVFFYPLLISTALVAVALVSVGQQLEAGREREIAGWNARIVDGDRISARLGNATRNATGPPNRSPGEESWLKFIQGLEKAESAPKNEAERSNWTSDVKGDGLKKQSFRFDENEKKHPCRFDGNEKKHTFRFDEDEKKHSFRFDETEKKHSFRFNENEKKHSFRFDENEKKHAFRFDENEKKHSFRFDENDEAERSNWTSDVKGDGLKKHPFRFDDGRTELLTDQDLLDRQIEAFREYERNFSAKTRAGAIATAAPSVSSSPSAGMISTPEEHNSNCDIPAKKIPPMFLYNLRTGGTGRAATVSSGGGARALPNFAPGTPGAVTGSREEAIFSDQAGDHVDRPGEAFSEYEKNYDLLDRPGEAFREYERSFSVKTRAEASGSIANAAASRSSSPSTGMTSAPEQSNSDVPAMGIPPMVLYNLRTGGTGRAGTFSSGAGAGLSSISPGTPAAVTGLRKEASFSEGLSDRSFDSFSRNVNGSERSFGNQRGSESPLPFPWQKPSSSFETIATSPAAETQASPFAAVKDLNHNDPMTNDAWSGSFKPFSRQKQSSFFERGTTGTTPAAEMEANPFFTLNNLNHSGPMKSDTWSGSIKPGDLAGFTAKDFEVNLNDIRNGPMKIDAWSGSIKPGELAGFTAKDFEVNLKDSRNGPMKNDAWSASIKPGGLAGFTSKDFEVDLKDSRNGLMRNDAWSASIKPGELPGFTSKDFEVNVKDSRDGPLKNDAWSSSLKPGGLAGFTSKDFEVDVKDSRNGPMKNDAWSASINFDHGLEEELAGFTTKDFGMNLKDSRKTSDFEPQGPAIVSGSVVFPPKPAEESLGAPTGKESRSKLFAQLSPVLNSPSSVASPSKHSDERVLKRSHTYNSALRHSNAVIYNAGSDSSVASRRKGYDSARRKASSGATRL